MRLMSKKQLKAAKRRKGKKKWSSKLKDMLLEGYAEQFVSSAKSAFGLAEMQSGVHNMGDKIRGQDTYRSVLDYEYKYQAHKDKQLTPLDHWMIKIIRDVIGYTASLDYAGTFGLLQVGPIAVHVFGYGDFHEEVMKGFEFPVITVGDGVYKGKSSKHYLLWHTPDTPDNFFKKLVEPHMLELAKKHDIRYVFSPVEIRKPPMEIKIFGFIFNDTFRRSQRLPKSLAEDVIERYRQDARYKEEEDARNDDIGTDD